MKIGDMTQSEQLQHLVSKRDRMVSVYRNTGNPVYRNGRELIASITVVTDPNSEISIGVSHSPCDEVEVQFIDDDERDDSWQDAKTPYGPMPLRLT